jgi:hypothetical protein
MVFKINHLGKVKSSLMLDPSLLTEAKSRAAQTHLTLGNVVEQALEEYLERVRQVEEEKERLKEKEEQRKRQEEDFRKKRLYERENGGPPSFVFR